MNGRNRFIERVKSGDQKALDEIYNKYKKEFLEFATRYSINTEDATDVYQDSIIVLYENIITGKLTALTSSVKTYVFAVGKHKIFDRMKIKAKAEDFSEYEWLLNEEEGDGFMLEERELELVTEAYRKLGARCRDVLKLFYYENHSIDEIKNKLGYTSKDVVKSQKSRCIKQIRQIVMKST